MRTAVYVSCAGLGHIQVFVTGLDGARLTRVQTVELGGALMPMAVAPDARHLYAVRRSEPYAVLTLAIDRASGRLQALGEAPLADNMAYVSTTAHGDFLLTASYGGDCIALNRIDVGGVAGAALQRIPTARHAHAVRPDPHGRAVWVSCLGADRLQRHAFDPSSGKVDESPDLLLSAPAGSGPRHFVFHPHEPWLFVIDELDGHVDTWIGGDNAGWRLAHRASLLPPGFDGAPWAAEIRLSPDGTRLFASERRSSTVTAFAVAPEDGRLTRLAQAACEAVPRGMALAPDGRWLFVAGQGSEHLGVLAVDDGGRHLRACEHHAVGAGATWVEAIALP